MTLKTFKVNSALMKIISIYCYASFITLLPLCFCSPEEIFVRLHEYQSKLEADDEIIKEVVRNYTHSYKTAAVRKLSLEDVSEAFLFVRSIVRRQISIENAFGKKAVRSALRDLRDHQKINSIDGDDLVDIAKQIFDLQTMYQLNASFFADGLILPTTCNRPLLTLHAYEIGKIACSVKRHFHCIDWMLLVLKRLEREFEPRCARADVLDSMALSLLLQGNIKWTWLYSKELMKYGAKFKHSKKNFEQLKNHLKPEDLESPDVFPPLKNIQRVPPALKKYHQLCRNDVNVTGNSTNTNPNCFYKRVDAVTRLKAEVMNENPSVILYHDVISPSTIAEIIDKAKPLLNRSMVVDRTTRKPTVDKIRSSLSAELEDTSSSTAMDILKRRAQEISNLDVSYSEPLKVVKYGIGGAYKRHMDVSLGTINSDRAATVLYYLAEPHYGGATVFFDLNLHVPVLKGSALVWRNRGLDGKPIISSAHASCPVISGSKWIANLWISGFAPK